MTSEARTEKVEFPTGFEVATSNKRFARQQAPAVLFSGKSGVLSLNRSASAIVLGPTGKNEAVFIAYNSTSKVLALKPVAYHLKPPKTYRISKTGRDGSVVLISFDLLSCQWGIPMTGRKHPARWDEKVGVLFVNLKAIV